MAVTEKEILKALSTVQDPETKRDIVSLGYVKEMRIEGGKVRFRIELTLPPGSLRDQVRERARQAVSQLPGIVEVEVVMTSLVRKAPSDTSKTPYMPPSAGPTKQGPLPTVRYVIPVASGKGGVGKSTVSVNLALALAHEGVRVGIMDADVYGPTIPTLLGIQEKPRAEADNRLIPIEKYGLKVMSMGFFIPEGEAVVWRGPMLHKTIEQFLGGVVWGDLDYLIVDLPPGTGDIQLSLCQTIPLTGAVIVSTPQDVALHVATKAIAMFRKLNCPILGVVENMSYYVCGHCGKRDEIFGSGGAKRAASKLGFPFLGEIPLATAVRVRSDEGEPIVASDSNSEISKAFLQIAQKLISHVRVKGMSHPEIKISF